MADHQALFCVGGVKGLKQASQDEFFARIHKIYFLNTNYGGSPRSVFVLVV
jgi:hypothetical protein